ncbi:DNA cytosine methyltransferase [Actinomyces wuliandei]|uniref:DNA cytosine methyltransferase n=1 Tax=Actinomyces wuliandei TaxID=2057743 RepID=UPI0019D451DD
MRKEVGTLSIRAVDLFCGVGGLTHGLAQAGIDVVAGIDIDPACRYPYEANNEARFVEGDVNDLEESEVERLVGGADVSLIAGCAPCQPFSTYSRSGRGKRRGSDWQLVEVFGRLVKEVQPDIVTMENVPQLLDHPVYSRFVEDLSGYSVGWSVVQAARIGVPQTRKRLVLVASRLGDVGSPLAGGEGSKDCASGYRGTPPHQGWRVGPRGPAARRLSAEQGEPGADTSLEAGGGTWRDWPEELRAACHRKTSGATYPSVYGRMGQIRSPRPPATDLPERVRTHVLGRGEPNHHHSVLRLRQRAFRPP